MYNAQTKDGRPCIVDPKKGIACYTGNNDNYHPQDYIWASIEGRDFQPIRKSKIKRVVDTAATLEDLKESGSVKISA